MGLQGRQEFCEFVHREIDPLGKLHERERIPRFGRAGAGLGNRSMEFRQQSSGHLTVLDGFRDAVEDLRTLPAQPQLHLERGLLLGLIGKPCPQGACAVGLAYGLTMDPVTFGGFFGSATFRDLASSGASTPNAGLVDPAGVGTVGAEQTDTSVRGRRGSDTRAFVFTNPDALRPGETTEHVTRESRHQNRVRPAEDTDREDEMVSAREPATLGLFRRFRVHSKGLSRPPNSSPNARELLSLLPYRPLGRHRLLAQMVGNLGQLPLVRLNRRNILGLANQI